MEIVAVKREGSNVLDAECSKVRRLHDLIAVRRLKNSLNPPIPLPEVMYGGFPCYLMEVFSVRFLNFEPTKYSDMYGCIMIGGFPIYVVFSRKHGEPLDIDSEGFIKLQDPKRVIRALGPIYICPYLFRYQACTNQLKQNDSTLMWRDHLYHDIFMCERLGSLFGEIEVNYSVYRYGVVAHVDVTLTGCRFPTATTVNGLITAHNSSLGEECKSVLFSRGDGEHISLDVSPCKDTILQLPLARCKIAVPLGSYLIIGVEKFGTPDQTIAKNNTLEFRAGLFGQEVNTIIGATCQVNVGITWSYYSP